jgi:flagellar biogenesis protein FliO
MDDALKSKGKRGPVMEFLVLLAFIVAWIILQAWVLPRFGVKT